jgi:hypothetical protein
MDIYKILGIFSIWNVLMDLMLYNELQLKLNYEFFEFSI